MAVFTHVKGTTIFRLPCIEIINGTITTHILDTRPALSQETPSQSSHIELFATQVVKGPP
jgi:hypothetical protein